MRLAVDLNLPYVPADRLPAPNLPSILFRHAAADIIAAIPLEPAARIVPVEPAFPAPDRQGLTGADSEIVQRGIAPFRRQFRAAEPGFRKFLAGVGHVLAAEDAQRKHLFRRQFRLEFGVEISAGRLSEDVAIIP